jgi:hypothetical protein
MITTTTRDRLSHTPGSSETGVATSAQQDALQNAVVDLKRTATAAASAKPGMVVRLTQLAELRLAGNNLSGNISDGIQLLKNLRVLDLSGNLIGGQLPLKLDTLSKLQVSDLQCCLQSSSSTTVLLLATCYTALIVVHSSSQPTILSLCGIFKPQRSANVSFALVAMCLIRSTIDIAMYKKIPYACRCHRVAADVVADADVAATAAAGTAHAQHERDRPLAGQLRTPYRVASLGPS